MLFLRQSSGIEEVRAVHSQPDRMLVHQIGESFFTASNAQQQQCWRHYLIE